jgi:TonB family protein
MLRTIFRFAIGAKVCAAAAPLAAQDPRPGPDGVYEVAEVEVRPEALNLGELGAALYAKYPPRLKAAGVNGTATVSMIVGRDGVPAALQVVSSSDSAFHAPTLAVLAMLRFSPALVSGRPVPVRVTQTIGWETRNEPPRPDSTGAYEFSDVETVPHPRNIRRFRSALQRLYPAPLRAANVAGEVYVRFRAEPDGRVSHVHVIETTDERFNEATISAVHELRFTPARMGGRPVPVWIEMPVAWNARSRPGVPARAPRGLESRSGRRP